MVPNDLAFSRICPNRWSDRNGRDTIQCVLTTEDDGAYRESICGTWHMPIGTLLIFRFFANNVRTAGPIGMGEALIGLSTSGR